MDSGDLNEKVKVYLVDASLPPTEDLVIKVVSGIRKLSIPDVPTRFLRYPYYKAVLAEIYCKELHIPVVRDALVAAISKANVSTAPKKKFNTPEYISILASCRALLKQQWTKDKVRHLLSASYQSDVVDAAVANQSSLNTWLQINHKAQPIPTVDRVEHLCAAILAELKSRGRTADAKKLAEIAEITLENFKVTCKTFETLLEGMNESQNKSKPSSATSSSAAHTSKEDGTADSAKTGDERVDLESQTSGLNPETASISTSFGVPFIKQKTLGKRNLTAVLQADRSAQQHCQELLALSNKSGTSQEANSRLKHQQEAVEEEERRLQVIRDRRLYELWRDTVLFTKFGL